MPGWPGSGAVAFFWVVFGVMIGCSGKRTVLGVALFSSVWALAALTSFQAWADLPAIRVPAAVRPAAHGTPAGGEQRILQVGVDLSPNEQINTGPTGQTHLLFLDGSSISIGPNASLTLDKFVCDPGAKEGELVVSVSKGLFRFVGGRISKKRAVLFKAPNATIGTFDGSFFRGGSDPAAEMGGTLKISGIDYQSTAIFAAKKLP